LFNRSDERTANLLPSIETTLQVAGRGNSRVLRCPYCHGGTLAESAVE